jgi:hypothetical protein
VTLRKLGTVLLAFAWALAGCVVDPGDGMGRSSRSNSVRMPPNYRVLIAQYMLTHEPFDKKVLSTAKISEPRIVGGGLFGSDPMPVVCVSIYTSNMLGMHFTGYLEYTILNGRAVRLKGGTAIISETCGKFSQFREVMTR